MTKLITTYLGNHYERRAWTGGDKPRPDFPLTMEETQVVRVFLDEQLDECGGLGLWACAGTSPKERLDIFWNRAVMDAWRTMHP